MSEPTSGARPLYLGCLTLPALAPTDLVDVAAAAGFHGVTLRYESRPGDEPGWSLLPGSPMLSATERRLAATRTEVLDLEFVMLNEDMRADDHEDLLATAARLRARYIAVVSNDVDVDRAAANLALLAERAARRGVKLWVEFVPFLRGVRTLQDAVRLVVASGRDDVGVMVDALHLQRSGGSPDDVADLPVAVPHVQLCDAPLGAPAGGDAGLMVEARGDRLLPGDGDLPLDDLLVRLPDRPVVLEAPVPALLRERSAIDAAHAAYAALARVVESAGR